MESNKLKATSRKEFRAWLEQNHEKEQECWVAVRRDRPKDDTSFWYLDAVEEALCFGWIDSVWKNIDGTMWNRFSRRQKGSPWTELNKERVRRLERLGKMTDAGRAVLPDMNPDNFTVHPEVEQALKEAGAWETFQGFPALYQRIRAYNVAFYMDRDRNQYEKGLEHLIASTLKGEMYGEWNDYGRLLEP